MTAFAYDTARPGGADLAIRDDLAQAHRDVWERIASPGSWWTGAERVAIARTVRAARAQRSTPPWLREKSEASSTDADLPPAALEAARRIALEPQQIDREWCDRIAGELGDAAYVELAAVAVCTTAIDAFAEAIGAELEPLPAPTSGDPDRKRPDGVGDDGAYVPMSVPWVGPNVARALSLAPDQNAMFMRIVGAMYAVGDFAELVWKDRPLSRPQIELVAARVSAVNECFY